MARVMHPHNPGTATYHMGYTTRPSVGDLAAEDKSLPQSSFYQDKSSHGQHWDSSSNDSGLGSRMSGDTPPSVRGVKAASSTPSPHAATVSAGSTLSRYMKTSRLPDPTRAEVLFAAVARGLKECIEVTKHDIENLQQAQNGLSASGRYDSDKQLASARTQLNRLEQQLVRVEQLHEQYSVQLQMQEGLPTTTNASLSSRSQSSSSLRGGVKDALQLLGRIEQQFELLIGSFQLEMKGVAGFARVCPGDQYEVSVKYGQQRWKTRGKVLNTQEQRWDVPSIVFNGVLVDSFEIRAAELKGLSKSILVGDVSFDIKELHSAYPQLMTVSLNRTGSLKLKILVTWCPLVDIGVPADSPWTLKSHSSPLNGQFSGARRRKSSPGSGARPLSLYCAMLDDPQLKAGHHSQPSSAHSTPASTRSVATNSSKRVLAHTNGTSTPPSATISTSNSTASIETPNTLKLESSLSEYLAHVCMSAQRKLATGTQSAELQRLIHYLKQVEASLKPMGASTTSLSHDADADADDLDDNWIAKSKDAEYSSPGAVPSGSQLLDSKSVRSPAAQYNKIGAGTRSLSGSPFELRNGGRQRSTNQNQGSAWLSTGSSEFDLCVRHHLVHCDLLLRQMGRLGPFKARELEAQFRLGIEAAVFSQLTIMARTAYAMLSLSQIIHDLQGDAVIEELWRQAISGSQKIQLYAPTEMVQHALQARFGDIVRKKYPDLVDKVFDKLVHILTDSSTWAPELVSVFQFVAAYKEKHLPTVVESLAHETWIIQNLCSGRSDAVRHVMQRLRQVPVPPPPDCLKQIGVLLTMKDGKPEHMQPVDAYLTSAQGALRDDLINVYMTFLEDDSSRVRAGACLALAILKARRSIGLLVYIYRNDAAQIVKDAASVSILSFGAEGKEAFDAAHLDIDGFESIRI